MKMQTIPSRLPFERALQTLKDKSTNANLIDELQLQHRQHD